MEVIRKWLRLALPGCSARELGPLCRMWLGGTLALACIALLDRHIGGPVGLPLLIGSFGASAVLVFGAPSSPLARPRNIVGGHVLSALAGVASCQFFGAEPWLASGVAVGTAIAIMSMTGTLHPPGGATAVIAVTGGEGIRQLGWLYAVVPCLTGALFLILFAWLFSSVGNRAALYGVCLSRHGEDILHPVRLGRRARLLRCLRSEAASLPPHATVPTVCAAGTVAYRVPAGGPDTATEHPGRSPGRDAVKYGRPCRNRLWHSRETPPWRTQDRVPNMDKKQSRRRKTHMAIWRVISAVGVAIGALALYEGRRDRL